MSSGDDLHVDVTNSQRAPTTKPFVPEFPGDPEHRLPSHPRALQCDARALEVCRCVDYCEVIAALAMALRAPPRAAGQGVQTGELSGTVSSSDGLTLPGATITVAGRRSRACAR